MLRAFLFTLSPLCDSGNAVDILFTHCHKAILIFYSGEITSTASHKEESVKRNCLPSWGVVRVLPNSKGRSFLRLGSCSALCNIKKKKKKASSWQLYYYYNISIFFFSQYSKPPGQRAEDKPYPESQPVGNSDPNK